MTKQRRTFSQEFKQEAVALVVEHGYSYAAAGRSLGVNGALIGRCSMGRRANCYDNAAMESFFHTLKVELIHRERYVTRRIAKCRIFEYIETYYNRQRKHSAIGHRIPMLFEQAA